MTDLDMAWFLIVGSLVTAVVGGTIVYTVIERIFGDYK